jgi:hypothetical protein
MSLVALGLAVFLLGPNQGPATPLIQGNDPAQFELVGITATDVTIDAGELRLTGKPNGYFATRREYENYTLSFDWKFEPPADPAALAKFAGNSGLLVHITPPDKVWPRCVEVQLAQADPGSIFSVGDASVRGRKVVDAQKKAIKPVGEWNTMELVCRGGTMVCSINGVEVARALDSKPRKGKIGWQSEGSPIRFRNITIQPFE